MLYPLYIVLGVLMMYSIMIALAATSVWLGRNQSLYDFWFYITNFARYPMEIYNGPIGNYLRWTLTFLLPVLVVVNVPARLLAKPFQPRVRLARRVRHPGHRRLARRQPLAVPAGAVELSQRQQLS